MREITMMTGEGLVAKLAAGPPITFKTRRDLFGRLIVSCFYGTILLGNGLTEFEALGQASNTMKDMNAKILAAVDAASMTAPAVAS